MKDVQATVNYYIARLSGPDVDDACHSLRELGGAALPHLVEAFEAARGSEVQRLLGEVICQLRVAEALPFLTAMLQSDEPSLWKIALDGLVMLGDNTAVRPSVVETFLNSRQSADSEKRSWIDEALGQVRPG